MVEQRKRQIRRSGGRFYGFRINCESVPCLLAWTVRRIWDDPRRIPYLLLWRGSHDGKVKEAVRIRRGMPGTMPGTGFPESPFVEVKRTDGSITNIYLVWHGQPHGGRSLLLKCLCGNACRALYGFKVGYGPRFYEVHRADWRCRHCNAEAAKIVLDLGEPSYHGTPKPVIQYAQLYSFVREKNALAVPYQWDEDSRLQACVAVSRLVQPTTVSLRYAARIRYNSDSSIADISPANIRGVGIDTFPGNPPQRDWLIEADAIRLRDLLQKLHSCPLPDRASQALWYHEYAVRTYYIEIRWVLIATGLEALVHVEQHGSTRQFKCRVSQLATELGVSGLGIADAERAYVQSAVEELTKNLCGDKALEKAIEMTNEAELP